MHDFDFSVTQNNKYCQHYNKNVTKNSVTIDKKLLHNSYLFKTVLGVTIERLKMRSKKTKFSKKYLFVAI